MKTAMNKPSLGWGLAACLLLGMVGKPSFAEDEKWIELFNGKDLTGWKGLTSKNLWQAAGNVVMDPEHNKLLKITEGTGLLVNGPKGRTCNLYTEKLHGDCELHIEFMVPKGSNSGVYFQGLYEVQVLDSYGKEKPEYSDCGGIYGRYIKGKTVEGHAPRVNASKPPGQWQSFDVIFKAPRFDASGKKIANARFVKVVHNGKVVHEDVELKGPTRSHMRRDRSPTRPAHAAGRPRPGGLPQHPHPPAHGITV